MFGVKSDKYWYCFHSIPIKIDARDEMKIWETAIGWHCMKLLYGDTDYYVCNSRQIHKRLITQLITQLHSEGQLHSPAAKNERL